MGLAYEAIVFGATVGEAIDDMFPGDTHNPLHPGLTHIDLTDQDFGIGVRRIGNRVSIGVAESAIADEMESPFLSNTVHTKK